MCPECGINLVFEAYDPKTNNVHVLCAVCGHEFVIVQKDDEEVSDGSL